MEGMDKNRTTAQSPFGQSILTGFRGVSKNLFIILVFLLMSLPLFTTFNEILTKIVEKTGLYTFLTRNVVPFETRAVSLILRPFGIDAKPTVSHLFIERPDGSTTGIFFSWNCLGWQSAVLLLLTLFSGLSGNFPWGRKIEVVLLGLSYQFYTYCLCNCHCLLFRPDSCNYCSRLRRNLVYCGLVLFLLVVFV